MQGALGPLVDGVTLFALYVLLVPLPAYALKLVEKRIFSRPLPKGLPLPMPRSVVATDSERLVAELAWAGLAAPFIEESAFRGVPYLTCGFWGLVLGGVAWGLAHLANPVAKYRELVTTRRLMMYLPYYVLLFVAPGTAFFTIAWLVHPAWGYFYHVFNNVLAIAREYVEVRRGLDKGAGPFVGAPEGGGRAALQRRRSPWWEDEFVCAELP